jgi:hypothetical protein
VCSLRSCFFCQPPPPPDDLPCGSFSTSICSRTAALAYRSLLGGKTGVSGEGDGPQQLIGRGGMLTLGPVEFRISR